MHGTQHPGETRKSVSIKTLEQASPYLYPYPHQAHPPPPTFHRQAPVTPISLTCLCLGERKAETLTYEQSRTQHVTSTAQHSTTERRGEEKNRGTGTHGERRAGDKTEGLDQHMREGSQTIMAMVCHLQSCWCFGSIAVLPVTFMVSATQLWGYINVSLNQVERCRSGA